MKFCGIRTDIWHLQRNTQLSTQAEKVVFPLPDPKDYKKATLQSQELLFMDGALLLLCFLQLFPFFFCFLQLDWWQRSTLKRPV